MEYNGNGYGAGCSCSHFSFLISSWFGLCVHLWAKRNPFLSLLWKCTGQQSTRHFIQEEWYWQLVWWKIPSTSENRTFHSQNYGTLQLCLAMRLSSMKNGRGVNLNSQLSTPSWQRPEITFWTHHTVWYLRYETDFSCGKECTPLTGHIDQLRRFL